MSAISSMAQKRIQDEGFKKMAQPSNPGTRPPLNHEGKPIQAHYYRSDPPIWQTTTKSLKNLCQTQGILKQPQQKVCVAEPLAWLALRGIPPDFFSHISEENMIWGPNNNLANPDYGKSWWLVLQNPIPRLNRNQFDYDSQFGTIKSRKRQDHTASRSIHSSS